MGLNIAHFYRKVITANKFIDLVFLQRMKPMNNALLPDKPSHRDGLRQTVLSRLKDWLK